MCFQPLRSRSRVIWTSKVAYIRVRVSLGLFRPLIMDEVAPIVWGNLYTSVEFIKSIQIATSLEWEMLGWDTMISFTFMCNETSNRIDANPGTSENGNTPLGQTLNYDHHSTSISTLWLGLVEYVCTHPLLTYRLRH